jgi:ribosome-associated toxin RatA of RatAB toxin-antitoxin module
MLTFLDRCAGSQTTGGRISARRRLVTAVFAVSVLLSATLKATPNDPSVQDISVREQDGVYRVEARFAISQPGALAFAVLTDYEQIPRFMPDVRTSIVLERADGRTVVEQEAVARVMMFSKRIQLVLEVQEEGTAIRFRDRSGKSFVRYEGSWHITELERGAAISYQLDAKPSFDVPEFLLKRLLKRDANLMIERLKTEIAARSLSGAELDIAKSVPRR